MKNFRLIVFTLLAFAAVSCARKQVVQSTPSPAPPVQAPLRLQPVGPFFQKMIPGTIGSPILVNLEIPLADVPAEVTLDSVYFKGMKTALRSVKMEGKTVCKAKLNMKSGSKVTPPEPLESNEVVLVFRANGKRHLQKISNLTEKPAIYLP